MALIELTTHINAPVERVFDLARSIDAHTASTSQSNEKAIEGRTQGLMESGDTVTWEATHFGIKQRLKVHMTVLEKPNIFEDVMIEGAFSMMKHRHCFARVDDATEMIDQFEFKAPFGFIGQLAELLFLKRYMRSFLIKRNRELKHMAESDGWQKFLPY